MNATTMPQKISAATCDAAVVNRPENAPTPEMRSMGMKNPRIVGIKELLC
jgi:hypothetical protein